MKTHMLGADQFIDLWVPIPLKPCTESFSEASLILSNTLAPCFRWSGTGRSEMSRHELKHFTGKYSFMLTYCRLIDCQKLKDSVNDSRRYVAYGDPLNYIFWMEISCFTSCNL